MESKIDKNEIPIIVAMWEDGKSQITIAEKYHVTRQAISRLLTYSVPGLVTRKGIPGKKRTKPETIIIRRTTKERFWDKVDIREPEECWPWKASVTPLGYGRFRYSDSEGYAHRTAWILTNGPIPKDKWILHKCNNPRCCNIHPKHVYMGTPSDNERDARESNMTFCTKKV